MVGPVPGDPGDPLAPFRRLRERGAWRAGPDGDVFVAWIVDSNPDKLMVTKRSAGAATSPRPGAPTSRPCLIFVR